MLWERRGGQHLNGRRVKKSARFRVAGRVSASNRRPFVRRAKVPAACRDAMLRASAKRAPAPSFYDAADYRQRTSRRAVILQRLLLLAFVLLAPIACHGGWPHEIPPPQSVIVASTGAPPKSRHITVQARNHSDHMAQGERSAAAGGEASHTRQEEHRSDAAEGAPDILRMQTMACTTNCSLIVAGT